MSVTFIAVMLAGIMFILFTAAIVGFLIHNKSQKKNNE